MSPDFESPAYVYRGWPANVTCVEPSVRLMVEKLVAVRPSPGVAGVTNAGQACAQPPLQTLESAVSGVNMYNVMPSAVVRILPSFESVNTTVGLALPVVVVVVAPLEDVVVEALVSGYPGVFVVVVDATWVVAELVEAPPYEPCVEDPHAVRAVANMAVLMSPMVVSFMGISTTGSNVWIALPLLKSFWREAIQSLRRVVRTQHGCQSPEVHRVMTHTVLPW